jgi:hypothetical protein
MFDKLPGMPTEKPKDLEGYVALANYFVGLGLIGLGVLDFLWHGSLINPFTWLYPFYFW